jgi:YesN/AraC family two-component response regulator
MNDLKMIREKVTHLRVLVVDDEELIREGTIQFMKKFCAHVDGADNGESALKKFNKDGPYDVILTDVKMPKMTGFTLVEALKNIDAELFIAVMTGSPDVDRKLKDHCDFFMTKPIGIDEMKTMLELVIQKKGL